jgi:cytochrome c oxidase cbb3-type subunit 3
MQRHAILIGLGCVLGLMLSFPTYAEDAAAPFADATGCTPVEEMQGDAARGSVLHIEHCAECHGHDGKAEVIVMHMDEPPRDQTDAEYMRQLPDAFLFLAICNGGEGVGRSLVMPRWGDFFTNQEIYDLIAHIRSFSGT